MTKQEANELSKITPDSDLKEMFIKAFAEIENWNTPSRANKGLSRGTAWNILFKAFKEEMGKSGRIQSTLSKRNFIWCFGEFLPGYVEPEKKKRAKREIQYFEKPDCSLLEDLH